MLTLSHTGRSLDHRNPTGAQLAASARSGFLFVCCSDCTPASFPCVRPLLPSSDRSAGQRNQPSHSTVLARPVCLFVCVSAAFFSCARSLLTGQRNQPSHSTVLARPVCPFVCVRAASFPCRFLDLGLNFLLASAYCTRAHTLSLDSFCRPAAGKSSIQAGLSSLCVYAYVVDCAPASPYAYSSSTHRFPDERTPI
jgi:hypothetical protein